MRVLQMMECTIGGTRRHLRDLVHGLADRGVEVEVVCSVRREPRMADDIAAMRARGVVVHEVPMVRAVRPGVDVAHTLRILAIVLDRGFDVVHTHSSKAGALGRFAALLGSGAARVHTPHTYAFSFEGGKGQGGEDPGPLGLILATERLLGRLTHRLINVSEAERREGVELRVVPPERARVVSNGIDPAPFAEPAGGDELRAELGIPADAPVVGTVGLVNDAKGHDVLVDALARLPREVHALIVGHGEGEAALRGRAEQHGVADRVHVTGWRDEVSSAHAAMDVFVLPSRWEGMSYALLEAMAAGLPAVSTDVNGSREALDPGGEVPRCGLIVPREDATALAAAVKRLLDDDGERRRLAAAAPERVAARFTVDRMLDATLEVYREALGRP